MSRTRGEGRSGSEKSGRLVAPGFYRRRRADRKAEEEGWEKRSGAVTTRKIEPKEVPDERSRDPRPGEQHAD